MELFILYILYGFLMQLKNITDLYCLNKRLAFSFALSCCINNVFGLITFDVLCYMLCMASRKCLSEILMI